MGKAKELSEFQRIEIIRMTEAGMSTRAIGKELKCSANTVSYTLRRYREHHTIDDLHRKGRGKIYTPREERLLIRKAKLAGKKSSSQLAQEWKLTSGIVASSILVRRILHEHDPMWRYAYQKDQKKKEKAMDKENTRRSEPKEI